MTAKNLNVALIMPPFKNGLKQETIPLGLSYIGAVLQNNGFKVKGFNLHLEQFEDINLFEYDLVGISATTSMFNSAIEIADKIKKIKHDIFIVVGGAHATALPEKVLEAESFDAVCLGEGEGTMLDLALALRDQADLSDVEGIVYKKNGSIYKNKKRENIKDLDTLPFPAKEIFDVRNYPDKKRAYGDIIASRGCPFRCTNCKPGLDNISPYRLRSVESVIDEMEYLGKKYGVKHFSFSDSELAGPKRWVLEFCKELKRRGLKLTFSCNGRTDQVDFKILKELKNVGCIFIGYGVESGSNRVLEDILHKGISLNQTKEIVNKTLKIGIGTGTWFMVGIPGEKWGDILKTIEFAKELNSLTIEVNIATPWPDTGFYNVAKINNWLISEDWEKFNEKHTSMIETPYLSKNDVLKAFNLFKEELQKNGWKIDVTGTRLYHPHFFKNMVKLNLIKVLSRGLQKEDIKRAFMLIKQFKMDIK